MAARAGEHDLLEPAVLGLNADGTLKPVDEAGPRVLAGQGVLGLGNELRKALLEQGVDEALPVGEAAIDGADPDARSAGDLVERDPQAAFGERLACCLQDQSPVALGVAT
jgi:hypothetical protein